MAAIEQQNIQIKNGSSWYKVNPFPVGYIYLSYTNTSPATTYGGTWTEIKGRFPYFNGGTRTGGSNTHTLSIKEMPSHAHKLVGNAATPYMVDRVSGGWAYTYADDRIDVAIEPSGNGAPHNNMPAYQTLYAWRRTA